MMAGLFFIVFMAMVMATFSYRRIAIGLFWITFILSILLFYQHISSPLAIQL